MKSGLIRYCRVRRFHIMKIFELEYFTKGQGRANVGEGGGSSGGGRHGNVVGG